MRCVAVDGMDADEEKMQEKQFLLVFKILEWLKD